MLRLNNVGMKTESGGFKLAKKRKKKKKKIIWKVRVPGKHILKNKNESDGLGPFLIPHLSWIQILSISLWNVELSI